MLYLLDQALFSCSKETNSSLLRGHLKLGEGIKVGLLMAFFTEQATHLFGPGKQNCKLVVLGQKSSL